MEKVKFIMSTELNSKKKEMSVAEAAELLAIRMKTLAEELEEKDPIVRMYGEKFLEAYDVAIKVLEKETFAYQVVQYIDQKGKEEK